MGERGEGRSWERTSPDYGAHAHSTQHTRTFDVPLLASLAPRANTGCIVSGSSTANTTATTVAHEPQPSRPNIILNPDEAVQPQHHVRAVLALLL